jgi:endo-1,4-beta-xylanase
MNKFNQSTESILFVFQTIRKIGLIAIIFSTIIVSATGKSNNITGNTDKKTLQSQFTTNPIKVDGIAEAAWENAKPSHIEISMNSALTAPDTSCITYGDVRSLWDGALLYLLINVSDKDVTAAGKRPTDKDGVEIYLDFYNDKFPKYEEDDGIIRISCEGELTGSGVYTNRLKAYASALHFDAQKLKTGYTVELAISTGGIPMKNGSLIGMDFAINDAVSPDNRVKYHIFWNNGYNKGIDDNSGWGEVMLTGYDGNSHMALVTFLLSTNIKKAESITRGIWVSEHQLDKVIAEAKKGLSATNQKKIDESNNLLDHAIYGLRRNGKFPDPYNLPEIKYLPDPFTFLNGTKVKSIADWSSRCDEIKDLVQYYEYGYLPKPPQAVTASIDGTNLTIVVNDKGKTASFKAKLTVPTLAQCGKSGPYPVVVCIDFWASAPSPIYLNAGYAVLSMIYSSVASDNYDHTGAFYSLYPYDIKTGNDAGTLLAWAWGASRSVDALSYLMNNNSVFKYAFDLDKLVVTGFSRCGKATLLAGLLDERFKITNPGASGAGGAASYRYDSFGNTPARTAPFGNVYAWGVSTGCEVLGDRIRYQGWNSNEMLARFLNPGRMYKTTTFGYGERLPYDHHEILAAIAPRAVIITAADNDYANGAEGDCISMEAARSVFRFLGVDQNLALNLRRSDKNDPKANAMSHSLDNNQIKNLVDFSNMVFYGSPIQEEQKEKFYTNPYLPTFDKYYDGVGAMMPWLKSMPQTSLSK